MNNTQVFAAIFGHPSGAIHLPALNLISQVELKLAGQSSILAISIKMAIHKQKPAIAILTMIRDQATDNYNAMADLLGCKLTTEILNLINGHHH